MAAYPGTLPQLQLLPVTLGLTENRIVSTFDAGPAKVRQRYTNADNDPFSVRVGPFSRSQVASFKTWWKTTLKSGTLSFDWTEPETGSTVEMRFDPRQPPPSFESQGVEGEIKFFAVYNLELVIV